MNRRSFLRGLGSFMILPGAGRVWSVPRPDPVPVLPCGLYEQLQACGRIVQPTTPPDMRQILDALYGLKLERIKAGYPDGLCLDLLRDPYFP